VNPVLSQSSRDFSDAMQQMIIEAERAMYHIQDSVPVSIRDYHSLAGKGQGLVDELAIMQRAATCSCRRATTSSTTSPWVASSTASTTW
jgi:hypothetical protein